MPLNATITTEPKPGFLLIESKGELRSETDLQEHCHIIFSKIQEQDCKKILIYEPETNFPKNKLLYYTLVNYYKKNLPKDILFLKIAVVIAPEFKEIGDFWETVCVNQGLQYYTFTSYADAHAWLMADK